ncbi:MAG: hypothetical protein ACKVU2_14760 [Saprospiraceae bacterium]
MLRTQGNTYRAVKSNLYDLPLSPRQTDSAMQIKSSFRFFLFSALLAALAPALSAQTLLEITTHQRCIFPGGALDEELYRFPDSESADSIIRKIAALNNGPINFEWVQTNVESAAAVLDGGKRYLLYSLDFLEKSSPVEKYGALAHAIGHHVQEHTFTTEHHLTEELEADRFMSWALSVLGFSETAVFQFLLKNAASSDIPFEARRAAVVAGLAKAEIVTETSGGLPFDDEESKSSKDGTSLPAFPWPPPKCNTRSELPMSVFKNSKTLGDTERKLRWALENKGYTQHSYFSVPNGFAMVTQLEQYNGADGAVRNDHTRWLEYPAKQDFAGILDYLTALVVPHKGYFRLFVFVVTDQPFGGGEKRVSKEQASAWLNQGFNKLPNELAAKGYSADYDVTALVYEFEVPESNRKPVQKCPSPRFSAKIHLRKAGLSKALGF